MYGRFSNLPLVLLSEHYGRLENLPYTQLKTDLSAACLARHTNRGCTDPGWARNSAAPNENLPARIARVVQSLTRGACRPLT